MNLKACSSLIDEIKRESDEIVKKGIVQSIDLNGYLSYLKNGNRLTFEDQYFERRRQLITLALDVILEKKQETIDVLENAIWQICNEFTWGLPPHLDIKEDVFHESNRRLIDLFAAETAQSLGEIIEILNDELSQQVKTRVKEEIDYRIFTSLFDKDWNWEHMENNWSAVVAGSIGMVALAILPAQSEKQIKIIERLNTAFESYFRGFPEDGVCPEGVGYWVYGFGYYIYFADKYNKVYKDDKYLKRELVSKIAAFPYNSLIGEKTYVPFSDASDPQMPTGLLSFCKRTFGVPIPPYEQASSVHFENCYRWAHVYRNLIWTDECTHLSIDLSNSHYFEKGEWLIIREQSNDFSFAARGGSNRDNHNHNDIGNFVLGDDKELILVDLGAGEYTRDYFLPEKRYEILNNRSLGHSVPYINFTEQKEGDYEAQQVNYLKDNEEHFFDMDLSKAYPDRANVKNYFRKFLVDAKERTLILTDEIEFHSTEKSDISEDFISYVEPIITDCEIIWPGEFNSLILNYDNKKDEAYVLQEVINNHFGEKTNVYITQITNKEKVEKYKREFIFKLKIKKSIKK